MAFVQAGGRAITMIPDYIGFDLITFGTVGLATPTQLRLVFYLGEGGTGTWDFYGSNLAYSFPPAAGGPAPDLTGGTLVRMVQAENGAPIIDISGMSLSAATFWSQARANDALAILSGIFAGDDTLYGSDQREHQGFDIGDDLIGFDGNDSIGAGAGFDTLDGVGGNDFLDGGADIDMAYYGSAAAAYAVVTYAGTTGVVSLGAAMDGVDKLVNVELIGFADEIIDTPGENFRPLDYIASYADLAAAFGANAAAGFDHYLYAGAREGRVDSFDGLEYIASYRDLVAAFGANADAGAMHYIVAGRVEGRATSFDGLEYIASYGDLIEAFRVEVAASANHDVGTLHYLAHGYAEGRTESFDPLQYLANYSDLRAVFGADTEAATLHFIAQGYFEGRTDHA
jgi:Ca2+-binding RTX toxin-like protein